MILHDATLGTIACGVYLFISTENTIAPDVPRDFLDVAQVPRQVPGDIHTRDRHDNEARFMKPVTAYRFSARMHSRAKRNGDMYSVTCVSFIVQHVPTMMWHHCRIES